MNLPAVPEAFAPAIKSPMINYTKNQN
jgi:hypothetical protein